jgi:hypothetical protein
MMYFKIVTIKAETVLGENEDFDKSFFDYLGEYSISHKVLELDENQKWPTVEYTGGPIALSNMLKERFGLSQEEIEVTYPEIKENQYDL